MAVLGVVLVVGSLGPSEGGLEQRHCVDCYLGAQGGTSVLLVQQFCKDPYSDSLASD